MSRTDQGQETERVSQAHFVEANKDFDSFYPEVTEAISKIHIKHHVFYLCFWSLFKSAWFPILSWFQSVPKTCPTLILLLRKLPQSQMQLRNLFLTEIGKQRFRGKAKRVSLKLFSPIFSPQKLPENHSFGDFLSWGIYSYISVSTAFDRPLCQKHISSSNTSTCQVHRWKHNNWVLLTKWPELNTAAGTLVSLHLHLWSLHQK